MHRLDHPGLVTGFRRDYGELPRTARALRDQPPRLGHRESLVADTRRLSSLPSSGKKAHSDSRWQAGARAPVNREPYPPN